PAHPQFGCLQYTFLSQISHREDYRRRLADLYEDWRGQMALLLRGSNKRKYSARTVASLIQAVFHGVAMQAAADPNAFDRAEMTNLCLDLLNNYLTEPSPRARASRTARVQANGVNHE
ncbi:MAG TPA: TetR family transcriptional regulator C-terminal domain-containing protein, partial [Gemmataceae bacterium]|nr:TetR family transcriptional regulator C-terminal domain-containing protein [Gemmataceae bacterium]